MHIGISTSVIQRGKTGVAQYVFALVRALLAHMGKHRFSLLVLEEDLPLFGFVNGKMAVIPVVEKYRPPVRDILWHQARLPGFVRQLGIDLLHVPSYRRMLWPRPCPLVATIHDLAPFHLTGKYDWKRMFYGRVVARQLSARQDAIISISQSTARDIVNFFGVPQDRITVIPNGIDHDRFFPGSREEAKALMSQRYGLSQPFFLYVARLEHPAKNHVRLISAFEEFKGATHTAWQLVFGGSEWHGADAIHEAIRRSSFAGDIRCLGFVPDSELPDLYRAADVFVYPSLYEGFGLPPIEAMACGCPVIASKRGSLAEVVGQAAAAVDPEDFHTIAKQLYILATDAMIRNRFRAAGLAQARKFDWQQTALDTVKLYERAGAKAVL